MRIRLARRAAGRRSAHQLTAPATIAIRTTRTPVVVAGQRRRGGAAGAARAPFRLRDAMGQRELYPEKRNAPGARGSGGVRVRRSASELELPPDPGDPRADDVVDRSERAGREVAILRQRGADVEDVEQIRG